MNYQIRSATLNDVSVLCVHRRRMFEDMGHNDTQLLSTMMDRFAEWVTVRLQTEHYFAWLAESPEQDVIASAGLWLMDWPPHVLDPIGPRGYILNVFTEPQHRRHGLARMLTEHCIQFCRKRHIKVVTLHASQHGRMLYESMKFVESNEMKLLLET